MTLGGGPPFPAGLLFSTGKYNLRAFRSLAPRLPSHCPNPHARPSFSLIPFLFTTTLRQPPPKRRPRGVPGAGDSLIPGRPHKAEARGLNPCSPPHSPFKGFKLHGLCPSPYAAAPRSRRKTPPPPHAFNGPKGFGPLRRLATCLSPALPFPVSTSPPPPCWTGPSIVTEIGHWARPHFRKSSVRLRVYQSPRVWLQWRGLWSRSAGVLGLVSGGKATRVETSWLPGLSQD